MDKIQWEPLLLKHVYTYTLVPYSVHVIKFYNLFIVLSMYIYVHSFQLHKCKEMVSFSHPTSKQKQILFSSIPSNRLMFSAPPHSNQLM